MKSRMTRALVCWSFPWRALARASGQDSNGAEWSRVEDHPDGFGSDQGVSAEVRKGAATGFPGAVAATRDGSGGGQAEAGFAAAVSRAGVEK